VANTNSKTLQDLVESLPNIADYFYNETETPHTKTNLGLSPIPQEFTNWRDEQHGWRDTAIIFDQSHHMPELFLTGPDALELLKKLGINTFNNFGPGRAKQYVCCNSDGYVIGECILYYHAAESFELVSGMTVQNWVHFHAETGGYDVKVDRDPPSSINPTGRRVKFRFGMDGPNAKAIFNEALDGEPPQIPFFRTAMVKIAGCDVMALGHGMAGHEGVELSGAYEDSATVRGKILEVGKKYGLVQGGTRTYFTASIEGGWIPYPVPAIYTGEDMRAFREWLPANGWEAKTQIGGSFVSPNIEDYYVTPWDLNVERLMKFDHDFIGREALEAMAGKVHRKKVTFEWNVDDVVKIFRSQLESELPYKATDFPVATYSFQQNDQVLDADGKMIGRSTSCSYTGNERRLLSLGFVDPDFATPGTEVTILWGEPNGGSRKPHVEQHRQIAVRAIVAPIPYAPVARKMKGMA
jgi:glycine cleavage system aminomethyltransferase T